MNAFRAIAILIALLGLVAHARAAEEGCALCRLPVAGVALGMEAEAVTKLLGRPGAAGNFRYDGACEETWSAVWTFAKKGLELVMTAEDAKGTRTVVSEIRLMPPSTTKLAGGIGIGSREADVRRAYEKDQSTELQERSSPGSTFMIGGSCEAVEFLFRKGKVVKVRIGMTYCDC